MTIVEALQDDSVQVRVVCGDRWLVCDDDGNFVVYSKPYGARKTRTLTVTDNETVAVVVLLSNTREER